MITINKFSQLVLLFGILLLPACRSDQRLATIPDAGYIAFSLREAQRLLEFPGAEKDSMLQKLGGITRLVGAVVDRENDDIILIGKKNSQLPFARFEDLLVALRSRIVFDELPMVSIDAPSKPERPEEQEIRFSKSIVGTSFSLDFLASDIILKRYSLKLEEQIREVTSYKELMLEQEIDRLRQEGVTVTDIKSITSEELSLYEGKGLASEGSTQSRFWFNYKDPYTVRTDGTVFCILSLDLDIIKESADVGSMNDTIAGSLAPDVRFAQAFSENYYKLCETFPVLHRLKLLFDFVALAEGLKNIKDRPQIDYLLYDHHIQKFDTPKTYPLIKRTTALSRSDGKTSLVQLSGGIKPSVELEFLNAGNVSYLKKFVLESRPEKHSLFWRVPIDGWEMPNAKGIPATREKTAMAQQDERPTGFSVSISKSVVFDQSSNPSRTIGTFDAFPSTRPFAPVETAGVEMNMVIDSIAFILADSLIRLRNEILKN